MTRHFWISRLTAPFVLWGLLRARGSRARFFAAGATPAAAKIIAIAGRLRPGAVELTLIAVTENTRDYRGYTIVLRREWWLARLIHALFAQTGGPYGWLPPEQRRWGGEWVRILAARYSDEVFKPLLFLTTAETFYRAGSESGSLPAGVAGVVIAVQEGPLRTVTARYFQPETIPPCTVLAWPPLTGGWPLKLVLTRIWITALALLRVVVRRLRLLAGRPRPVPGPEWRIEPDALAAGTVLVEYEKTGFPRMPFMATIDWLDGSGVASKEVVFYCDRNDSPCDPETRKLLESRGYGWIDYREPGRYSDNSPRTTLDALRQAGWAWPGRRGDALAFWRWLVLPELFERLVLFRSMLRTHRALVLCAHQEPSAATLVQDLAARQEQVLNVFGFWSVGFLIRACYSVKFADLVITKGSFDRGYFDVQDISCQLSLDAGLCGYDGLGADDDQQARNFRSQLAPSVTFTVVLFDSSHHPSIYHTPEQVAEYYTAVLSAVRDTPDWGCLLKPKVDGIDALDTLAPETGVHRLIAELQAEGRCLRLDSAVRTSIALRAADVAACYSINSAGFFASALTGKPAIHLDLSGLGMHPAYRLGAEGRLIFRSVDRFVSALRRIAAGDQALGRSEEFERMVFTELDGRRRVGQFMRHYLAERRRGSSLDQALATVAAEMTEALGPDRVYYRRRGGDAPGDRLWRETIAADCPGWPTGFFPPTASD